MNLIVPGLNYPIVTEEIYKFIRDNVERAYAEGVVVGLSGGVDSSLTASLCVRALGRNNVLGVLLPTSFTPVQDTQDAEDLAKQLGIRTERVGIDRISQRFFEDLKVGIASPVYNPVYRIPAGNIRARIRMTILYYYANLNNYLVAGTGDRSEALIGFFTKYGDGGVDFLPIVHLYKTQVRELAEYLGVSQSVAYKPSSPQLYPGHKATDEIPLDYDELDRVLIGIFDKKLSPLQISGVLNIDPSIILEIQRRFDCSNHKRVMAPGL